MEILYQFHCQGESLIVVFLQAPVGFTGILFRLYCHHMTFQFCVVTSDLHDQTDEKAFQGMATGQKPFIKTHPF